ncbi:MAG: aspartate aminotransferase family protein [Oscillospiraceae bacterium]|nr:aspartate aminotransferase family protein [Oscillospiraceae bacterium]
MTYAELKAQENQYVMNTYGRFPIALDHGEGAILWDVEGKRYVDLTSGIGVCCLGYNNETIVSAITEQAHKLMHVSNLFTTAPMVEAAKKLVTRSGMSKVFFANSGAEANEGMIKLARKYSFDKYGADRAEIITLNNSFHGRTVTTLKATGQDKFHQYFFPFTEGFAYADANDLASVKAKINAHTCAVMIELIQGEGGVLPLDVDFVHQVAALCRENDLLLLVDEVQTGIGRTGTLFCFQQYGILPDVVSMAKGLGGGAPIGAVMAAGTCDTVLGPGTHATTFGGTPMICAAANAVLDTLDDDFLAEVVEKGDYLKQQILGFCSDKVHDVRGKGLMLGIIVDPAERAALVSAIMEQGVLVRTAGSDAIRLLPPLSITREEMDEALAVLRNVLA